MNIKLIDITKIYNDGENKIEALKGINLDINEGDYIAFVGPSGSGKTTLLSIISGLIKPTRGDIYFDSKKLTKISDYYWSTIRRKYFGLIFQKKVIIPHLTLIENIILPFIFSEQKILKIDAIKRAEELLNEFDLYEKRNSKPSKLSGGELQKLTILRAFINNPKIIIADEPTGDLDINSSKKIVEIFKKFNKIKNLTIVMVTHNYELAKSAKTIYSIKEGRIDKILKG